MIDNKKFLKEISNILASAEKAKKVVLAEMDKVDEKYRKLADEEKKSLNEILANLNAQMKLYGPMVNQEAAVETTPEPAIEEEEKVVDTVFPENNEEEPEFDGAGFTEEDNTAPEAEEESKTNDVTDAAWADAFGDNLATDDEVDVEVAEEAKSENGEEAASDINEDWPMPEDWK